jgi:4-diphosphocytidyl-2-C-methyl-D-erythritol kinase
MLRLRAPAKLNLSLHVLGRRPDGYHELETVFERIDLADELVFEDAPELLLTCDDTTLSCGEDNLVLRAARALLAHSGQRRGARIALLKRIPIAAGLGGGSSDAASALRGLNTLWDLGLRAEALVALGAALGSDVPFFLQPGPFALGRGRGERCEPLAASATLWHVLVAPRERLSTREVYAGARFDLTSPRPSSSMLVHALCNGSLGELATGLWNDLEPEAIRRCPPCYRILTVLRDLGCLGTLVSGSGPSVFGLCRDHVHAQEVVTRLRALAEPAWRIDIIHTDSPSLVGSPSTR